MGSCTVPTKSILPTASQIENPQQTDFPRPRQDWKDHVPPGSSLPTDDKARKTLPIFTYLTEYFPDALLAEVGVAVAGNDQHNPGQPLHWAREKSKDQLNTAFRHLWDHKSGVTKDTDGQYHLAKAIWRLKAELQLLIEKDREGT